MQVMYMYGDTGYLDTIFSSESITDLVSSISAVKELVSYDQQIIEELKDSERIIKVKTEEIAQKESDLKVAISALNQDKEDLRALQVAKQKQLTDTNDDIKAIREQIRMLEQEKRELSDKLYMKHLKIRGNAMSDQYGLKINAKEISQDDIDVKKTAKELLDKIQEVLS